MSDFDPMIRGLMIGMRLAEGKAISSRFIRREFSVSPATAKRDMARIAAALPHVDLDYGSGNSGMSLQLPQRHETSTAPSMNER